MMAVCVCVGIMYVLHCGDIVGACVAVLLTAWYLGYSGVEKWAVSAQIQGAVGYGTVAENGVVYDGVWRGGSDGAMAGIRT